MKTLTDIYSDWGHCGTKRFDRENHKCCLTGAVELILTGAPDKHPDPYSLVEHSHLGRTLLAYLCACYPDEEYSEIWSFNDRILTKLTGAEFQQLIRDFDTKHPKAYDDTPTN